MDPIIFRPLQQGDGPFLCSIFRGNQEYYAIFHDPEDRTWAWEERVSRFLQQQVRHFILEAGQSGIGWLSCSDLSQTERELDILVLKREYLGRGYGTAALSGFLQQCREDGVRSVVLNVSKSNTRAIRFYDRFGFAVVAEQIIPECNDATDLVMYQMRLEL